ncbi:unnamed protein product [Heligmosomoides polygyrus]|uniref:Sulfate_transp domain-containing protein n=1 Tax=Heligmosomoides polygyrus TaxID=6339 RepID=A0A183FDF7_HELPZ|nr:unnamed protein product [Heligmosomoides polygyrus]
MPIAVVIMAVHISMAKLLAKKHSYSIDIKQEFFAAGFTSAISSFFPVFPCSCSLARTLVNSLAGTRTQVCSFKVYVLREDEKYTRVSGTNLSEEGIVCLLQCILASIIIVALFDMFLKFKQLPKLWVISKIDLVGLFKRFIAFIKTAEAILQAIWVVAFAATAFADVIIGLLVSILFALLTTLMRQQL